MARFALAAAAIVSVAVFDELRVGLPTGPCTKAHREEISDSLPVQSLGHRGIRAVGAGTAAFPVTLRIVAENL
jgi:hypothetical protein